MSVVNVGSGGVDVNGGDISSFFSPVGNAFTTLSRNPALSIELNKLGYILAIVAGALFALGAILALLNLIRDRYGIHMVIILFALERVATYVIRALLYKNTRRVYVEVFEILEAAGTAIIVIILYHVWAGTARSRTEGATKRGRTGHCCLLTLASAAILAGSGLFIAGAILQDRASSSANQYSRGFSLRKAAVIIYGAVLLVFDILAVTVICRRGARAAAPLLLICGLLLSAKAGFQIYSIWHNTGRYYENKFFWPLLVLTELLVLLILVTPGFIRHAFRRPSALPITDNGQYIAGGGAGGGAGGPAPYAPAYQGPAIQPTYK